MKKIFTLALAFMISTMAYGQVDVVYHVDVADYVASGNTIAANGIRVGGNFATQGATNGSNAMLDWNPTDSNSAMTDLGSDVWQITVTYPSTSIGVTQLYKFVNGDWGTNEGTDTLTSTIASDNCGIDDGAGNINRELVIPSVNGTILKYCWDACYQCDGSGASVTINEISSPGISVYPNPSNGPVFIDFYANSETLAKINVYNVLGQQLNSFDHDASAGNNSITWDPSALNGRNLSNGTYLIEVLVNDERFIQRIAISL
ncbi:MAG: Uncharacterised protein [Owenweeksia sp. TMED14]|nr:MAG: Uncharacterised protein [Owenweeksia sp. TMED14]